MNARAARAVALAALAVLALALAAATLPSPVQPTDSGGSGAGGEAGVGPGSGGGAGTTDGGADRPGWLAVLIAVLQAFMQLVAVLAVLLFLAVLAVFRREVLAALRSALRGVPRALLVAAAVLLGGAAVLAVLSWLAEGGASVRPAPVRPFPGGGGGDSAAETLSPPSLVPLALVGAVAVAGLVLFYRGRGDGGGADDPDAPSATAAVGRAAGGTAGRIRAGADVDVDNAVYRAWREMTALLEADRRTTTPREFAALAADADMDPGAVEELTRLFEDVRYGGAAPTEEHERRAREALRRIEADDGGGERA